MTDEQERYEWGPGEVDEFVALSDGEAQPAPVVADEKPISEQLREALVAAYGPNDPSGVSLTYAVGRALPTIERLEAERERERKMFERLAASDLSARRMAPSTPEPREPETAEVCADCEGTGEVFIKEDDTGPCPECQPERSDEGEWTIGGQLLFDADMEGRSHESVVNRVIAVSDDWKARAEAAEARIDVLEAALERASRRLRITGQRHDADQAVRALSRTQEAASEEK